MITPPTLVIKPFGSISESGQYGTSVDNIMGSLKKANIIQRVSVYTPSSYISKTAVDRYIFEPSLPVAI